MPAALDLTGEKFGKLTAIAKLGSKWICECECGVTTLVPVSSLRSSNTSSCGCLRHEVLMARNIRHGLSKTVEYSTWCNMLTRCYNERRKEYPIYGGRGIGVCIRWRNGEAGLTGFDCFLQDMGQRPSPHHSLDRIDNDSDYGPENCRWATRSEQAFNKRRNMFLTVDGTKFLAASVAISNGIPRKSFENRVRALGWSIEDAASVPLIKPQGRVD